MQLEHPRAFQAFTSTRTRVHTHHLTFTHRRTNMTMFTSQSGATAELSVIFSCKTACSKHHGQPPIFRQILCARTHMGVAHARACPCCVRRRVQRGKAPAACQLLPAAAVGGETATLTEPLLLRAEHDGRTGKDGRNELENGAHSCRSRMHWKRASRGG